MTNSRWIATRQITLKLKRVNGTWAIQNAPLNIPRSTSRDVFQSKIQFNSGPEISQSMLIIFRIYYTVIGKSKGQHDQVQLKLRVQMVEWGVWCYFILVSTCQYLSIQYTILAKDIVKSLLTWRRTWPLPELHRKSWNIYRA